MSLYSDLHKANNRLDALLDKANSKLPEEHHILFQPSDGLVLCDDLDNNITLNSQADLDFLMSKPTPTALKEFIRAKLFEEA